MKLYVAMFGLALASLAMAGPGYQHEFENGGHWEMLTQAADEQTEFDTMKRSELVLNRDLGGLEMVPILAEDIFQERPVWSNQFAAIVPYGVALRAVYEELVWSSTLGAYLPREAIEPCPRMASAKVGAKLAVLTR
jgi:hypothetical protein